MAIFFSIRCVDRSAQSPTVGTFLSGCRWPRFVFAALVVASLASCSTLSNLAKVVVPSGGRLEWDGLTVVASPDANLNTPVALDIVQVRDDAMLAVISAMPASKWFASRADMAKTFPDGLSIQSLEVPPGMTIKLGANAFAPVRQIGAFVFADYLTPGEHRAKVDQLHGDIVVRLDARSFSVSAAKPQ
jgi:type VI secretion system protein